MELKEIKESITLIVRKKKIWEQNIITNKMGSIYKY
jgi:hypothetical protein